MLHPALQRAPRVGLGDVVVPAPPGTPIVVVQPAAPRAIWPWVLGIAAAATAAFYFGADREAKRTRLLLLPP